MKNLFEARRLLLLDMASTFVFLIVFLATKNLPAAVIAVGDAPPNVGVHSELVEGHAQFLHHGIATAARYAGGIQLQRAAVLDERGNDLMSSFGPDRVRAHAAGGPDVKPALRQVFGCQARRELALIDAERRHRGVDGLDKVLVGRGHLLLGRLQLPSVLIFESQLPELKCLPESASGYLPDDLEATLHGGKGLETRL